MKYFFKVFVLLTLCTVWAVSAFADVVLPNIISSHMVLQRDMAVPVWGTADANEKVTVKFREQVKTATADEKGKWLVKLDPLKVGEPDTLTVAGNNTITLTDVLVGEVWIGSGQSNIDTSIPTYTKQDAVLREAAEKNHPQLRLYHSPRNMGWQEAKPDASANYNNLTVSRFSAQLFYFGLMLQHELNLPVGVIQAAKAGMPSAPFISQEGFNADPDIQVAAIKWDKEHPIDIEQKKYEASMEKWKSDILAALTAASPMPDVPVTTMPAPDAISKDILAKYPQPKKLAKAVDFKSGDLFELLVRPVIPFAIRGVLWDQGESYSGNNQGIGQNLLMPALIRDWRKIWGQGDFAWIFVQKQNGGGCALNPEDPINIGAKAFEPLPNDPPVFGYQFIEGFSLTSPPNTYLTITSDLGTGSHPICKSGYATRDSRVAMGAVYGKSIEFYGPIYQSFKVEGNKIRVSFTHTGKGLTVPPGQKLQGFAISGEDKKFRWAEAVIDGQTVVVSSADVPIPAAVRYWPLAWANLFNIDGLPAMGFETDNWR